MGDVTPAGEHNDYWSNRRIRELEAEIKRLRAMLPPDDVDDWSLLKERTDNAEAEGKRLREALRVFGSHGLRCARATGQYLDPPDYTCTCGLEAILDG